MEKAEPVEPEVYTFKTTDKDGVVTEKDLTLDEMSPVELMHFSVKILGVEPDTALEVLRLNLHETANKKTCTDCVYHEKDLCTQDPKEILTTPHQRPFCRYGNTSS
jgi:hypothetical protein